MPQASKPTLGKKKILDLEWHRCYWRELKLVGLILFLLSLYCFNLFIDTVPGLKQHKVEIWLFLMREVEIWESNAVRLVGKQLMKLFWFTGFKNYTWTLPLCSFLSMLMFSDPWWSNRAATQSSRCGCEWKTRPMFWKTAEGFWFWFCFPPESRWKPQGRGSLWALQTCEFFS